MEFWLLISAVCIFVWFHRSFIHCRKSIDLRVHRGALLNPTNRVPSCCAMYCIGHFHVHSAVRHKRRWTRAPRGLPSPITSIQLSNQHNKMHEGTPPCHNWHDGYLGRNDFRHNFARIHSPVNFHLGSLTTPTDRYPLTFLLQFVSL